MTELFQERCLGCKSTAPAIERTWTARECRIRDLVVRAVRGKWRALLVREIKVGNFALQVLVVLGASHHSDFGFLSVLVPKLSCDRKNKANNPGEERCYNKVLLQAKRPQIVFYSKGQLESQKHILYRQSNFWAVFL
jgi:hypothetical protein